MLRLRSSFVGSDSTLLPAMTDTAELSTETLVSARQGGDLLHVSPETMRRWAREGRITAIRIGPRCTRFRLAEIEALAGFPHKTRRPDRQNEANPGRLIPGSRKSADRPSHDELYYRN